MPLKALLTSLLATVASASSPTITSAMFTPRPTTGRLLHVRAVGAENKYGAVPLPIRNSRTAGANGQASVAGPCGGSNAYKAAGAPNVPVGSKVSLSLQYAAGHESAQNVFTATVSRVLLNPPLYCTCVNPCTRTHAVSQMLSPTHGLMQHPLFSLFQSSSFVAGPPLKIK